LLIGYAREHPKTLSVTVSCPIGQCQPQAKQVGDSGSGFFDRSSVKQLASCACAIGARAVHL
jgi:hypothetical protein